MRSYAGVAALAGAVLVQAGPTPTEQELPARAASLPTVTASGNGTRPAPHPNTWRHKYMARTVKFVKRLRVGLTCFTCSLLDWKHPLLRPRC